MHIQRKTSFMANILKAFCALGVFALLFCFTSTAHAAIGGIAGSATNSSMNDALWVMGMIITAINFVMWVLFWMLNILVNPDFIFSGQILDMLHNIWIFSRDTVNIIFAVLLIAGAIMWTIAPVLYAEKMRGLIPKFVTAVIVVNFSWFIPQVIIDASNVLAYSIYQIPTIANAGANTCRVMGTNGVLEPCKYVNDIAFLNETDKIVDGSTDAGGTWECQAKPLLCIQMKDIDSTAFSVQNRQSMILNGLIVNYAQLRKLVYLVQDPANPGAPMDLGALLKMLVTFVVVIIVHIALFFPILAMVAAFFIRIPVLWLTMAFMPFVAVGYVIGDHLGQFKETIDKISKNFLRAAFLPAMVAVPFAIGYFLLNAGMSLSVPTGAFARKLPIFAGIDTFWQLFWLMLSLGVLWVGVFEVLKSDTIMGKFTEGIKNSGQGLAKFAARQPLSLPFIPTGKVVDGKKESISLLGAAKGVSPAALLNAQETQYARDRQKIADAFGPRGVGNEVQKKEIVEMSKKIDVSVMTTVNNDGEFKKALAADPSMNPAQAKAAMEAAFTKLKNESPELRGKVIDNEKMKEIYIERRTVDRNTLTPVEMANLRRIH